MENNDREPGKSPRGIQSIDIGGTILNAFIDSGGFLRLKDLADLTGLATGKLHPYIVSFCNIGLLERADRRGYALGPLALKLGLVRLRTQDGFRDILRRVPDLAQELGLMISVSMWGPNGVTVVHLEIAEPIEPMHFNIRVGGRYYLTMTASGYVFRAFLPEAITDPVLDREFADSESARRAFYNVTRETYDEAIRLTRDRGYGVTNGMPTPGVSAISAPVFDHTGRLLAAVAAIGPSDAVGLGRDDHVAKRLTMFTAQLSSDQGFFLC